MTGAGREWRRRYSRYLNSEGWALTREACLRRDGYRCRRCGMGNDPWNPLQANHLSYDAYNATGRTPVSDRETLCRSCHQLITDRHFRRRPFGQWLRQWWWWLTLRQKAKAVALAAMVLWIMLGALIPRRTVPAPALAPGYGDGLPPAYGSTLVIPPRLRAHPRPRARREAGPPLTPAPPG